jgi:hypothetical protein
LENDIALSPSFVPVYYEKLMRSPIILQKWTPLIMLVAITGTTFSKAIAILDFELNQKYIATTLCENRGKPSCCCRGKCFLKKQLQKDEESNKGDLPFSKDKFEVFLFWQETNDNFFDNLWLEKCGGDHHLAGKYTTFSSPVFHPPAISKT